MNGKVHSGAVLGQLQRLFVFGTVTGLPEGQLVARFVQERDESAFEAIVSRHGPMVLGICRRLLDHPQDVEDAFQATFLVLVKKAGSLRDRDLLGNWLHGVAFRVATRSRRDRSRRRLRERLSAAETSMAPDDDGGDHELRFLLDAEVRRLPEKFRAPIILCYFEGMTHDEAAERLECPVGTVRSRMAKARELLRSRLVRRGIAPTPAIMTTTMIREWTPVVSPALASRTIAAAMRVVAGPSITAGVVSTSAATLTQGVLKTMTLTKMMTLTAILAAIGAAGGGAGLAARQLGSEAKGEPTQQLSPQEPLDTAIKALQQARNRINDYHDQVARKDAEIKAIRKELENLREVVRPFAVGGFYPPREQIEELLKPVATAETAAANEKTSARMPGDVWKLESVADQVARNDAEIKAIRKELDNLRKLVRPFAVGGAGLGREESQELLEPVAPGGIPPANKKAGFGSGSGSANHRAAPDAKSPASKKAGSGSAKPRSAPEARPSTNKKATPETPSEKPN
jgi:RNA polymerase sigma factor (sigma-70 family)